MNFLQGLQLLFLYLRINGTINWNWGIIMLPIIVDLTASAVMHVIKRGIIEEAIQRKLCENCEDNEDCEI